MKLREPTPAQHRALDYALKRQRIALFMQMRLGKNLVTIRWARHHRLQRILVVGPNDVLHDWRHELLIEGVPEYDIYLADGTRYQKYLLAEEVDTGWFLINYEAIRGIRKKGLPDFTGPKLMELPWNGIVLDESTAIRNPGAQTARVLTKWTGHIAHRAILSGLPNPQSEQDFFQQMLFLHGKFMGHYSFWAWRQQYFNEPNRRWAWDWVPKRGTLEAIKDEVHKTAFFMSRKEAGLGEHRVFEKRHFVMPRMVERLYKQVENEFAFAREMETNWATTRAIWMARLAGGFSPSRTFPRCLDPAKAEAILNLLKTDLSKEPVVIWFRFNQELFYVSRLLTKKKIKHVCIVGGKSKEENYNLRMQFSTGAVPVILMQLKMGRFGWDLSRADTEIRYSEDYDYETYAQSRDRIVSVRKQTTLLSISLVTKDTIDEDIVDTLTDRRVTSQTFNSKLQERLHTSFAIRWPPTSPIKGKIHLWDTYWEDKRRI